MYTINPSTNTVMPVAQVALPIPLPHQFDYRFSVNLHPVIGGRVRVPFGKRNTIGVVVGMSEQSNFLNTKLKSVLETIDDKPLYPPSIWRILHWAADYYHYPLGEILFHALPVLLRQGKPVQDTPLWQWFVTEHGLRAIELKNLKRAPKQQQALVCLYKKPLYQHEISQHKLSSKILQVLQTKGLCDLRRCLPNHENWHKNPIINEAKLQLNTKQAMAVSAICRDDKRFSPWLLTGITESSKMKIYLSVLEKMINRGRQALVLVPEISLISQTITHFRTYFNVPIDILHSGLNNSERMAVWLRARKGENAIVIGTRSALFTPFAHPSIIIVDEEHNSLYKQQEGWRYHARDLAVFRAREENIPIIMSSATPTLETICNAKSGKYRQLNLNQYNEKTCQTTHQIIDLKGLQLQGGLSKALIRRMHLHLKANNQILLFLNRRGFSSLLLCHDCSWIAECQRCNHYYALHQQQRKLRCHYCESQYSVPHQCSQCGSTHLIPVGCGTEQLEHHLKILFPDVPLSRIDRDTISYRRTLKQQLTNISHNEAHILIGTQVLTKGYHFPNVTLVSLLDADDALFSSDFRAIERFAQLYIQITEHTKYTGRKGEVLLQTHHPEHPLLQILLHQGYSAFANQVLLERKNVQLPPFTSHAIFRAENEDNQQAAAFLYQLRDLLKTSFLYEEGLWIMGPVPALQSKRRNRYRWQLLLQHPTRLRLQQWLKANLPLISTLPLSRKVKWALDIDPIEN